MLANTDGSANEPVRSKLHMQRPVFLSAAVIVGLAMLLSACGTGGSGNVDRDPTPPPLPEPVLSTSYTLSEYEYGPGTWFRYGHLRTTSGQVSYGPIIKVPETRTVTVEYDARQIEDDFNPEELFQFLLPWVDGEPAAPLTISDPDVLLKASSNLIIYQEDPADPDNLVISNRLYLPHRYGSEGQSWTPMRAVYAPEPVGITAEYTTEYDEDVSVDVNLVAGWNLVYYESDYVDGRWHTKHQAKTPTEPIELTASRTSHSLGSVYVPFDATYVSLFENRFREFLDLNQFPAGPGTKTLRVPTWLSPLVTDEGSTGFAEFLGAPASSEIPGAAELRVLLAELLTFEQSGSWWDAQASNGWIESTVVGGHPAALVYADRSAVVVLDNFEVAETGMTFRTESAGIQLSFGWNYVAGVPDPSDEDTLTLLAFSLGSDAITLVPMQ